MLYVDGWDGPAHKKYVNMVVSFIPEAGAQREFYNYASEPVESYNSENRKFVALFIQKQIDLIGAEKIVALATDNASTMTKAWKIIHSVPTNMHIMTYSCGCHMLNNFCKILVNGQKLKDITTGKYYYKCDYFRVLFITIKAVCRKLNCMQYQEYRVQGNKKESHPPSYTEIRWDSSFNIIDFCLADDSYDFICKYLKTLKGEEATNKDVLYFQSTEFKLKLDDLYKIIKCAFTSVRELELNGVYLSRQYWVMSEVDYLLKSDYDVKYPELSVEFTKLWNRSYTDISAVGFILDPLVIYIRAHKSHTLHDTIVGPIAEHEDDVLHEIVHVLGCPKSELILFKKNMAIFNKNKENKIDAKYFLIANQKVFIIYIAV